MRKRICVGLIATGLLFTPAAGETAAYARSALGAKAQTAFDFCRRVVCESQTARRLRREVEAVRGHDDRAEDAAVVAR